MCLKFSPYLRQTFLVLTALSASVEAQAEWKAGAAKVNITPSYPVRLSGYGSRTSEHESVKVDIWAKAIALAWNDEPPAIILTVDNCGIPATLRTQVLAQLQAQGVTDDRLAVCSTHTHCAPMVNGTLRNMFGTDLPADHQGRVDRYTHDLREWMVKAARKAIAAMTPASVEFGIGEVTFAMNRRRPDPTGVTNNPYPEGPVDHSLPVLKITDANGDVRAIFTSYACHCTTLSWNSIHPDWAGIAQLRLQLAFPKAVALTAIGCGADQNPYPRREEDDVRRHGISLAEAAVDVLVAPMKTISGPLAGGQRVVNLPFAAPPSKEEWQQRMTTGKSAHEQHRAKFFHEKLERGEALPAELPYTVMAWRFSDTLAMVFLNGEVVVDYGLRLKREFDQQRLWVNSYSNDVPSYIPSERVLKEGGYEADSSMIYYLKPGPFAPGLEDKIINAVHDLVPKAFHAKH
jgi:hypothetical protein